MAQNDRLAIGALDDRGNNIAQPKFYRCIGMVRAGLINDIFMEAPGLSRRGGKMDKSVSTVNIQHGAHRTHTVGGIEITVSINGVLCTPFGLAESLFTKFHAVTIGPLTIVELYVAKIVLITALTVQKFTENPLSNVPRIMV